MARYDAVIIGAGLGGLTAGAILARAGRKVLVIERSNSVGGAASSYKVGDLFVEGSLHETGDPRDPRDPKHDPLTRAGVLDAVTWIPSGTFYDVRGGPVGAALTVPDNFEAARHALTERFPEARDGIVRLLGEMEQISSAMGTLSRGADAFQNPRQAFRTLRNLLPAMRDWNLSLSQKLDRTFGGNEAVKAALAANLSYYHDDPVTTWWVFLRRRPGRLPFERRTLRAGRIAAPLQRAGACHPKCGRRGRTAAGGERDRCRWRWPRYQRHTYCKRRQRSADGGRRTHHRQRRAGNAGRAAAGCQRREARRGLQPSSALDLAVRADARPVEAAA